MTRKCPNCNGVNYAKILWGLPADMRELEVAIARKEIVLGGCVVTSYAPKWECNDCGNRWRNLNDRKKSFLKHG